MSTTRSRVRLAHIAIAAFTTGVVYSPRFDPETVRVLLRLAVLPGLAVTGAILWTLPKLRRLARRRAATGARNGQADGMATPAATRSEQAQRASGR
jgi:hypothetical protein